MDIKKLLDRHNIQYKTEGKNVAKDNINICCPLCKNDEGFHLGINPKTKVWGCWRNSTHRGRNLKYLFVTLLNISEQEASFLLERSFIDDDIFKKKLENKKQEEPKVQKLEFLKCFKTIKNQRELSRFYEYLYKRGFYKTDKVISDNKLLACLCGDYANRIIIPVYINNKLVTWTSRSIFPNIITRYKDLSKKESVIPIKETLFNYDYILKGGNVLVINEGPFDSMKFNYLFPEEYKATCLFTKHMTLQQEYLLSEIIPKYKKVIILLDRDEFSASIIIHKKLEYFSNILIRRLPSRIKDPGELSIRDTKEVLKLL